MSRCSILLIDDDDLFRKVVRLMLERAGHTVADAVEGGDGMRQYREKRYDVVITDLIMPGKEGLETIRELRAFDPEARIIAVSGGGRVDSRDYLPMARAFGAGRVLEKPFTDVELLQAIEALVGERPR